jgi:hypothetical protein
MKVLAACEFSGVVREAFAAQGHDAWSCDLLPSEIPGQHYQCDLMEVINQDWDMILAFPPCTFLANSGNKWFGADFKERFPDRFERRQKAIDFFMEIANNKCEKICIENPVGIMNRVYRKPDQIIQPWHFGHPATKATCLWRKNLPRLVPTKIVHPQHVLVAGKKYSEIHYGTANLPKEIRSQERSRTFLGVAEAMANQWGTNG